MNDPLTLTSDQARELIAKHGKITMSGIRELLKLPKEVSRIKVQKVNKNLCEIKFLLRDAGIEYVEEFRFHPIRKWRFDLAIPEKKIYVEYEGLTYDGRGGHQNREGYTANTEKYNAAAAMGWIGLRYTHMNFTNVIDDLRKLL